MPLCITRISESLPENMGIYESEVLFVYAIIVTGGKQYKVSEGDEIFVEKLDVEEDAKVTFDQVLAVGEGDSVRFGKDAAGATVEASVLKQGKAKKIYVMRYKPKKNEKRKLGHRQPYTKIKIEKIAG